MKNLILSKKLHRLTLSVITTFALVLTGTAFAGESVRTRDSFDNGWLFARYGLQADGSRVAEPGATEWKFAVTASSEESDKGNRAQNAMDGDANTRWCASGASDHQWLQVDFGSVEPLSGAAINWESPNAAYGFKVEVSSDGKTWTNLVNWKSGSPAYGFEIGGRVAGSGKDGQKIPFATKTRYVRIQVTSLPVGEWASIREVKFFDGSGNEIKNTRVTAGGSPSAIAFDDQSWHKLNLPHDWAIAGPFRYDLPGNTGKLPWKGIGWYRKHFEIPASDKGKRVFVDFDGAMANAKVYLNGEYVGGWPYGYQGFRIDLTDKIKYGAENIIAVRLDTEHWGSRWYPGAGIYRNVWLVKTAPVHVGHWGVYITTPKISSLTAHVAIRTTVENDSANDATVAVSHQIYVADANGQPVMPVVAAVGTQQIVIKAGAKSLVDLNAVISNPKLWDTANPHLYVAVTNVTQNGKVIDLYSTMFGVRTIKFTHDNGFLLNGKRVQIQGTCNHSDLGPLGMAFNTSAMARQLRILKEMGCNALRTSHNPPAPEFLDLADKMGFLVMCEAFDCWKQGKVSNDYSRLFPEWHEKDLAAMIRHFRNHPSIILWSTGNEVPEQYDPGLGITREMTDIVHKYDTTRPATFGASYPSKSAMNGTELQVDVHGMNYASGNYGGPNFYGKFLSKPGHEHLAGYGSETASTVSTRGEYPPCDPGQISSYDLQQPGWGSLPDQEFRALDKYRGIAGEFVWTGFDYLGEPTPFNNSSRSSYFGIIDLAGFKKDRFYLYQAHWRPDFPMAHIVPQNWNWLNRIGKVTPVFVYTSGDSAELFLNGKSLGKKTKKQFEYRLRWDDVKYQPGTLHVIAYKNGKKWAEDTVKTTGAAASLTATPDRATIHNDGRDLSYVTVAVKDKDGLTVPTAENPIHFAISGPGEIVATDNGDATCLIAFPLHDRPAFNGLALVIVRSKPGQSGAITVTAESAGLKAGTTTITAAP